MQKFLIVGVGGSGGATLRYVMDQLRADLRSHGIEHLPAAWQFLQIDVPPDPEFTEGLGSIRDLGGRYLSVSSPGNSYTLVANGVENALGNRGALRGLLGWAPNPKETASHVGVTRGAGQYRAVGRMLTLTDLSDIRAEMQRAWERLQAPDAWGALPAAFPGTYDAQASVLPIVVGSMAGGSGASMFLDVCRLLGRVPGLNRSQLGVFLYTADVFSALPASDRTGIDGNALGAIGEIIAAQARSSDACDEELFSALGIAPEPLDEAVFARVFPIGATIGGDGAKFGDGTPEGVFRGLGRAIAATMSSDAATEQYIKSKVENPTPPIMDRDTLGWGTDASVFAWGSFGYASLSLGRDRYAEYASQRLSRLAVDRLVQGHLNPQSTLPTTEQLNVIVEAQFPTILARLQFPNVGADIREWFVNDALSERRLAVEAQNAASDAVTALGAVDAGQAVGWVDTVRMRLPLYQAGAASKIRGAAYLWANEWALNLESAIREEYLRATTQLGLPFANAVVIKLQTHLNPVIDRLRGAPQVAEPLTVDQGAASRAQALGKTVVSAGHELAQVISRGFVTGARAAMEAEAARLGAEVLASFALDVLGGLERSGRSALVDLEAAKAAAGGQAGLAQLATTAYAEWPQDSEQVPTRFDHADNEVLLTTARDFPDRFSRDVVESVPAASRVYASARDHIVGEVLLGRWETAGGVAGDFPVLTVEVAWRPAALPTDPISNTPTPRSAPAYHLAVRPSDLLERGREHLRRPDQPFERFSSQTIEQYLNDPSEPQSVREIRAQEFVARFHEAMKLARPLVGVSAPMIQKMHPGHSLLYQYSFSAIPVSAAEPVAQRILTDLEGNGTLDSTTPMRFKGALTDTVHVSRIAIFGAYPKYSPLVFSSLLDQVEKRWSSSPDLALSGLWQWKRTRPLPGALAMSAAEQRAMVSGWFVARMLGGLVIPESTQSPDPVQVWDFKEQRWLEFQRRLLTTPAQFGGPDDWLPAVLESHTLALVRCNGDVTLGALQPYVALRRIADDTEGQPKADYGSSAGVRHIAQWLETGRWPSGQPSPVLDAAGLSVPGIMASERAQAAVAWLEAAAGYYGERYLSTGKGVGALAVRAADVSNVLSLVRAPMFTQVAQLTHEVLTQLIKDVATALQETGSAASTGGADVFRPNL